MPATHAILLDGDELARRMRGELKAHADTLKLAGIQPMLATILVGENPASMAYVARKHADCSEIGIYSTEIRLPADTAHDKLAGTVDLLNNDPSIHGLLVQFPLPSGLNDNWFAARIAPEKDIDGLHPFNLGKLVTGDPTILPCTPSGILALLREHHVPLAHRRVLIIGRGTLVGRPLALLLSSVGIDATVTLAHSQTTNLDELARQSDVIISAAGQPDLVTADMVKPGAAVIGVGISYDENGLMVSDIADDVEQVAGWKTPRHGSVGALTRAFLLENLLNLAQKS